MWVRADAVNGYVSEFDIYTGKVPGGREFGLGGNVVQRLARNITGCHHGFYYQCYIDNLLNNKIYACGTNNYPRKCYPKDLKTHTKSGFKMRGEYKYI